MTVTGIVIPDQVNVLPCVFFSILRVFVAVSSVAFAVRSAALLAVAMPQAAAVLKVPRTVILSVIFPKLVAVLPMRPSRSSSSGAGIPGTPY